MRACSGVISETSCESRTEPFSSVKNGTRWYAVQCQPHRERLAASHLINQGFGVHLPLREKTRRHARKIETIRTPFFPGYLFARLDLSRDFWRSVNGTVGVVRLVTQGDRPTPVPIEIGRAHV